MLRSLALLGVGVIAACGDGIAGPDASVPVDANTDLVTVEVRSAYAGASTRVFFQRADSTAVLTTTTDADGRVQAYIPPHAIVSVDLVSSGGQHILLTQLDVNPGDEVVFDDGSEQPAAQLLVSASPLDGGFEYRVRAPCPAASSTGDILLEAPMMVTLDVSLFGCETTGNLIVEATAADGTPQFLARKNLVLADNTSVELTGEYQPLAPITMRAIHVPPKARAVTLEQVLLDGTHPLLPAPGLPFPLPYDGFADSVETTMLDETWPDAHRLAKATADSYGAGIAAVYAWGPSDDTTTIDFGDDGLHEYLTRPTYSAATHRVGWLEADQGRLADAVLIELSAPSPLTSAYTTWRLLVPRTEHSYVTLPVLPVTAFYADAAYVTSVTNIAIDGGYERLRKLPRLLGQWSPNVPLNSVEWPLDAPTGRVVLQLVGNGGFF